MDPISENPYQTPETFGAAPLPLSNTELIRKEHLKTETSIKSIGILYYIGGTFLILASISILKIGVSFGRGPQVVTGGLYLAIGILQLVVGSAIRKLAPWSRIVAIILSIIGLTAIPIGTLIAAYILYQLFSKKGKMVFCQPYKEIIAATPHIKYKTPKIVWIIFGIFVALIATSVVFAVLK